MKAENRHYDKVYKERSKHTPMDKCGKAKCLVCHSAKVLKIPSRQVLRENTKNHQCERHYEAEKAKK